MASPIQIERLRIEIVETVAREVADTFARSAGVAGGILLGDVLFQEKQDRLGALVRIEAFLPASYAEPVPTSLIFTPATWEEWDRMRSLVPGRQVVGWVHSHPGSGVFFSGQDLINQQQYFAQPWQVAWVSDPVNGKNAIFRWVNGTMVETDDWRLVRLLGQALPGEQRSGSPVSVELPPVAVTREVATMRVRAPEKPALVEKDTMKGLPAEARVVRERISPAGPGWKWWAKMLALGLAIFFSAALITVGIYSFVKKDQPQHPHNVSLTIVEGGGKTSAGGLF
ncbi:MAG: Mov34/MPN/PAD-1 family protein [Heliobacteriaceae bacterium]|nr:Mov34/MPN/PAD-1 family protein [Heliobacteriaceae bacterium]